LHRDAVRHAHEHETVVTNVFSGRPARVLANRLPLELGPLLDVDLDFPLPMGALAPLRAKAEQQGSNDFTPLWSGQAAPLAAEMPARTLTLKMAKEAMERFKWLGYAAYACRTPRAAQALAK
jgi:nitronate monooxygenase